MLSRAMTPIFLAALWAALFVTIQPVLADGTFTRGDCNGDDRYDISDPIRLLDVLFLGGTPNPCDDACDSNDDGDKNLGDAIHMLDGIFGQGTLPPEPFEECGEDPTVDSLGCDTPTGDCLPVAPEETALLEPPAPSTAAPSARRRSPFRPGQENDAAGEDVLPFSGEYAPLQVELRIAGRGLDFEWARSYR